MEFHLPQYLTAVKEESGLPMYVLFLSIKQLKLIVI
jgi:hypothetical protein